MDKLAPVEKKKSLMQTVAESCYDWVGAAVIALIAVSLLFTLFFRVVNVSGDSMTNTLQNGEKLLLSSAAGNPKYGDIVVIRRDGATPLIKRVIGLPGDKIFINNSTGEVFRNGEKLDEPYVKGGYTPSKGLDAVYTVPEGGIFVMGDNRINSLDSRDLREHLTLDDVVGIVTHRLSPFESLRNGE